MEDDTRETDADLLARFKRIGNEIDRLSKLKRSDSRSRFIGSLRFTWLTCRDEIQERGLTVPF